MEQIQVIERVFAVTLQTGSTQPSANPPVVFLEGLASELAASGAAGPVVSSDLLDRVVVARLIESPPDSYRQSAVQYLLGCYARASTEQRARGVAEATAALLKTCKELIVSYSMLCFQGVVEPTALPNELLVSYDAREKPSNSAVPMPPGFMEDFAARHETEGLQDIVTPVIKELARRVRTSSPLGDYHGPLSVIAHMVSIEPMARVLVGLKEFLPSLKDVSGRGIELPGSSWLGPCFCVSPIPDELVPALPSITQTCFSNLESRRQGEVSQSVSTLRMTARQVQGELFAIIGPKALLGKSTREATLRWIASVIDGNGERSKMQMDPQKAASHGFFINFNAVLLKLCGPFMDPSSPNFWKFADARYVACSSGRTYAWEGDTKLGMTAEEDRVWRERVASSMQAGSSSSGGAPDGYHFICEAFLLTARALHLGVIKLIGERTHSAQYTLPHLQEQYDAFEAEVQRVVGTRREAEVKLMFARIKTALDHEKAVSMGSETMLGDPDFMGEVLAFYRLLCVWMMCTAAPQLQRNLSSLSLPLPEPAPREFTSLPEHFVEDLADLLLYVSRQHPNLLQNAKMDEVMLFLVVFMGSPSYVKSSHLRSKLADVMHMWLPQDEDGRGGRRSQVSSDLSALFRGHPVVVAHLVPTLLRLYVDVEFTDQSNSFYAKFNLRYSIGDILFFLWNQPQHREVWKAFGVSAGTGTGDYVRFCNMLISDSIYLLDECLKKLQDIKEKDTAMSDPSRWLAMSHMRSAGRLWHLALWLTSTLAFMCTADRDV
ncbi:hypothetical protein FOA52_006306 [Chlamydomonas sp. UWO 241]|nr:hypothetical protein FOA52_006306 [Chlamydomonas sp. UWO 241]